MSQRERIINRFRQTRAAQAEIQRLAEVAAARMIAKLDLLTSKPMYELTFDEFRWLITRFLVPTDQSERSKVRVQYLHDLTSDQQWHLNHECKRVGDIKPLEFIYQSTYDKIVAGKFCWPAEAAA